MELAPWGIHVCLIEPGAIATEIWSKGLDDAAKVRATMSERELERYRPAVEAMEGIVGKLEGMAIPAETVAKVVERALTARRPRTRYLVGMDAKIQALLAGFVPDRLREAFLVRFLKYPTRA